jgi:hypothetical protein
MAFVVVMVPMRLVSPLESQNSPPATQAQIQCQRLTRPYSSTILLKSEFDRELERDTTRNPNKNDLLVWVQLRVGEANIRDPYEVDGSGNVSKLKDAVKAEFPNALKHVDAPELKVYGPRRTRSKVTLMKKISRSVLRRSLQIAASLFLVMTIHSLSKHHQAHYH